MFAKDKVSQSLVDAVNKVLGEDKAEPKQTETTPQQLDEASNVKISTSTGTKVLGHRYGNSAKTHRDLMADPFAGAKGPKSGELEKIEKEKKKERSMDEELKGGQTKIDKNHNNKIDAQDFKILRGQKKSLTKMKEQLDEPVLDELINEVLSKDASAYDYIHDFVHSDNPKFAGKSKAKRKEMALAAYYAKQRNEEVDLEEGMMDAVKSGVKKVLSKVGGGSDEDQRKDLQRKMGVPQTGKKPVQKEEAEQPKQRKRTTDTLAGRVGGGLDNQHSSYKVALKAEESKPLSLAKEVAKKAYKKIKTETMMGKISN